jgi:hypothetical protein
MNSRIKELDILELILTKKINENNDKINSLQNKIDELKKQNKKNISNITTIINEKLLLNNNNNPLGFFVWSKCRNDYNNDNDNDYYDNDYDYDKEYDMYSFYIGNKMIINENIYKYVPIYDLDNIYVVFGKHKYYNKPNYNKTCL